jgi:hypothetical protein
MASRKRSELKIYELHVELAELHGLLQLAMGWMDSHLHSFEIGTHAYGLADADLDELQMLNEDEYTLEAALGPSIREFVYEYDFGDGWRHHIQVRPLEKPSRDWDYPLCVAGERSAPPEDVGGPHGYQEFLDAIQNPKHPEHKRTLIWVGGVFDPEGFDLNTINRVLRYEPTDEE